MARTGPTTLALPPFSGATRRLVLIATAVFFASAISEWVLTGPQFATVFGHMFLIPRELFHGAVWQVVTFTFLPLGLTNSLFTLIFLWFLGAMLEEVRGSRWLYEIFFTSAIGGGLLASALTYTHLLDLNERDPGFGPYAAIYGLLIAILLTMGEQEFLLFFLIRVKAKYMVIVYLLFDMARLLLHAMPFDALLNLSGALCGFLFLKFVPRRGLSYGISERYFALRNEYYRSKRRRAAKKFEVYMRKQNRDVHFDANGRYVDPDEKNPNDKRWMN
jgi:membrane associated rhomboid family serine protease